MEQMKAVDLIEEIRKLPFGKRIYVIERSVHLIRKQAEADRMKQAANELCADYMSDKELTAFTSLDFENFYETR